MRRLVIALGLAATLCLGGCGAATTANGSSGGTAGTSGTSNDSTTSTSSTLAPLPPGRLPAKVATMVCDAESQRKIAQVLGIKAHVPKPSWDVSTHAFSCRFEYPTGLVTLTVQEEPSWSATKAYFHSLGQELGDTDTLGNLGQGAFTTRNGSVVVRKDWKVLLVDVAGLHASIGKPPATPAAVAFSMADIILGCWSGD